VLVVDDDEDIRDSLQFVLESAGYQVATATDGRDALGKLHAGMSPRLVVLDVSMPVMTGPELLAAMQRDVRLARVPVCVMSGNLAALGSAPPGALVLQKPIQVDRLLDFLGKLAPPSASSAARRATP
jgi:two-component system response regulator CpxR